MKLIYKIMGRKDWVRAVSDGVVPRAPVDVADGYIHLSAEDQVLETARLYFAGRDDLVAAAFDAADFGGALKWEASRGVALFPHLYGDLPAVTAVRVRTLTRSGDGYAFGGDLL